MRGPLLALLVACSTFTVACGGKDSGSSPTAPSAVEPLAPPPSAATPPPSAPPVGGPTATATLGGTVATAAAARRAAPLATTLSIQVVGTSLSATVEPGGRFTLQNIPTGDVQLRITGDGHDATVSLTRVESGQTIEVRLTVSGSQASVDSDSRSSSASESRELEGRVEALVGSSGFVVAGQTVAVDGNTVFRQGSQSRTFADVKVGIRVHVRAQVTGSGLVASSVEIQNTNADLPIEVNGAVAGLSGSATDFSFAVGGTPVRGDGHTTFFGSGNRTMSFADLKDGVRVEIKGQQRDGFVYATRIHVDKADDDADDEDDGDDEDDSEQETEVKGTVSGVTGQCPALTLSVAGMVVETSASTRFTPSCAAVANGVEVEVEGVKHPSNGRLVARSVEVEDRSGKAPTSSKVEIKGTIAVLTGSCPALALTVSGIAVDTSAATEFKPSCASLRNGDRVEVEGTKGSDGRVKASAVERK